jgi:hypothetical protein
MTGTIHTHSFTYDEKSRKVVQHMRAIEAGLSAQGLITHLTDARAGLDLRAVLSPSGKREVEIWIDEDGRVELRYWAPSGASPDQITATAMRALNAVLSTTPEAGPSRD